MQKNDARLRRRPPRRVDRSIRPIQVAAASAAPALPCHIDTTRHGVASPAVADSDSDAGWRRRIREDRVC